MNISKIEKREEAIARMRMLHVFPRTILQFEQDGKVNRSEPPFGAFYWMDGEDLDRVHSFEEKHDALVYLVIRSYTEFGVLDSFLFVGDSREEWENDRESLQTPGEGVFAYVYNCDEPIYSEFGYIGVARTPAAGFVRIW